LRTGARKDALPAERKHPREREIDDFSHHSRQIGELGAQVNEHGIVVGTIENDSVALVHNEVALAAVYAPFHLHSNSPT